MPKEKIWNVEDAVNWTWKYFEKKGLSESRLKSELLLAEILETDRTHIYVNWKNPVEKKVLEEYRKQIQRCVSGEPFEYVIGYKEFMSYKFEVNSDVLIPRQETEELVEWVVTDNRGKDIVFADIGTGSGVIGITIAKLIKNSKGFLTDISKKALETAKRNAQRNNVNNRVEFFEGDLLEPLLEKIDEIELIVANPPYIGYKEINAVEESVIKYEPQVALFAGEAGNEFFLRVAEKRELLKGKQLYFEIGFNQKENLEEIFSKADIMEFRKDIYGNWRDLKIVF